MVSYAKGTSRSAAVDEGWPWQVEIEVPWNGLGRRLGEMTAWIQANAPMPASSKRSGATRDTTRFAFIDREPAVAFQALFGGELVEVPPPKRNRRISWP